MVLQQYSRAFKRNAIAISSADGKGNTTVMAEFQYRLDIAFSFSSYLMDVSSKDIPDVVYFLRIAARHRTSATKKDNCCYNELFLSRNIFVNSRYDCLCLNFSIRNIA